ncbi:sigma-70 family RNA polymerase sigma factor [Leucobacter coleopterorum]|uniref:Sigma-70 family RNA polymerase sigma factor n=1 Tax=Leucobacter coleopterorum TaxID=2714933 RepID=A0ABX6JXI2_9MICO|nr:sigma-70 family RNA polymerase sigma factor [Leucobacter coleopterorum]QIM17632.1 sigma-70 family RNA polymerase sigma factor [Leucobacter coleopterorum]
MSEQEELSPVEALEHESADTERSDAELSDAVRRGDSAAFAVLYERHSEAALRHANYLTRDSSRAEDLVAESFVSILSALQRGLGPKETFRGYLFTTISNRNRSRANQNEVQLFNDADEYIEELSISDSSERIAEANVLHRAFQALPEKWQRVLWLKEVDGLSPETIGSRLHINANAAIQLAFRAREGLRLAYLAEHIDGAADAACVKLRPKLVRYGRGQRIGATDKSKVVHHLDTCESCRAVLAQLEDLGQHMRGIVVPIVILGAPTGLAAWLFGDVAPASAESRFAAAINWVLRHRALVAVVGIGAVAVVGGVIIALSGSGSDADPGPKPPVGQSPAPSQSPAAPVNPAPGVDEPAIGEGPATTGQPSQNSGDPERNGDPTSAPDSLDGETDGWVVVED